MIPIIILLTFIVIFLIQDRYFKNKKKYKNKNIKIYQNLKIPIFLTCVITLIYIFCTEKKPETSPDIFMRDPNF